MKTDTILQQEQKTRSRWSRMFQLLSAMHAARSDAQWGFKRDRCDHEEPICWTVAYKAPGGVRDRIQAPAGRVDGVGRSCDGSNWTIIKHFNLHNFSFAIHSQSELLAFIFK